MSLNSLKPELETYVFKQSAASKPKPGGCWLAHRPSGPPGGTHMSIDPKALNAIRLVRDMTSGSSRSLAGPIKPKWLTVALPKVGKHRCWIDHVVEGVLCAAIDAYRVKGREVKPFWRGPA